MIGVVIATHGDLAKGFHHATKMFFGETTNIETIGLQLEDSADDFQANLEELIKKVDSGEGVVVLTDLNGGTPFNRSLMSMSNLSNKMEVLSGVNLPMIMDTINHQMLGTSLEETVESIVQVATEGIAVASLMFVTADDEDDDF
ncbi:MAG: PTS sugar transporter subunit IIA [Streptococcaceae bacterium]|nr:PTS sugar transporter subunit IIA [Streptococcaceae bacterium]